MWFFGNYRVIQYEYYGYEKYRYALISWLSIHFMSISTAIPTIYTYSFIIPKTSLDKILYKAIHLWKCKIINLSSLFRRWITNYPLMLKWVFRYPTKLIYGCSFINKISTSAVCHSKFRFLLHHCLCVVVLLISYWLLQFSLKIQYMIKYK